MAGASKFGGTENGADCSKCGGTVAVLFKTRNGTALVFRLSCTFRGLRILGAPLSDLPETRLPRLARDRET